MGPRTADFPASAQLVDIHWPEHERERQCVITTRAVEEIAGRSGQHVAHPAEPGHTFAPSTMPLVTPRWRADLDRRIDYLMIRCGAGGGPTLRVTHCARILTTPVDGVWATDHFGLLADVEPA